MTLGSGAGLFGRTLRYLMRRLHLWSWAKLQYVRAGPFFADRRRRPGFVTLGEAQLRATRRSDTVFIFGSGFSINEITPVQWDRISRHDTLSFNYFPRQRFVRADYHIVGELAIVDDMNRAEWVPAIREYALLLMQNPLYANTILGLQEGWPACESNRLAASGLLRPGVRVFRYRRISRVVYRPPSRSLAEGLVHGAGTIVGCVNFAVIMGWREIVLAGVDLYDSRYFWLRYDRPRTDAPNDGIAHDEPHKLSRTLVRYLEKWRDLLEPQGVTLSVLNPRSLLAEVMPVHRLQDSASRSEPVSLRQSVGE